jgi:hypothetical protein
MFRFTGVLTGMLCGDCIEALEGARVRLYRTLTDKRIAEQALAKATDTLAILTDEQVKAKEERLLAEIAADANGKFTVTLGDDERYEGEAFEIDVYCESVPHQPRRKGEPRQFTITTLQPQWRQTENGYYAAWEYTLPHRFWCLFRELFDAWVICGHVTTCSAPNQPVGNVKVFALDADWITDDELGYAITDSTGHFRIDYSSDAFKQTFLSPWINVETPFPPFNSGPDLYFRIEAMDGTVLLAEGRGDARDDVGPCVCVDLCVEIEVDDPDDPMPTVWTRVGSAFIIPDSSGLNDIDADGYAGTGKYAIYGSPLLKGSAPRFRNGNPVEYRFLVSMTTAPNGTAPVPIANFTRIVGVAPNENLFVPTVVGELVRLSPFRIIPVVARLVDLDAQGWFDVNRAIERTFIEQAIAPADQAAFLWNDVDTLMQLNTAALTTAPDVPATIAAPGQPVPVANRIPIESVALRFEAREVVDRTTSTFITLSETTLNALIINNNSPYLRVAMKEHLDDADFCGVLHGPVHVAYTGYHPHLGSMSCNVASNSGGYNVNLNDGIIPVSGNTNPAVNHRNNPASLVPPTPPATALSACTYLVTLSFTPRLHNGEGAWGSTHAQTTFYHNGLAV